ncbi:hypothetical protein TNCV_2478661 [Trichonephila clavipes]|nr:hypothetical protein TNCV_2478661 [Trichonephila clavipes]
MANWSQCPKFPKIKAQKGDAQNDRNKININENRPTFNSNKTTPTISYANAAKNEQQMAARKPVSEPATNSSESNSETNIQNPAPCSDIFLAIREFRNFFGKHPELITIGKALRNASSEEEKMDIFYEAMASTSNNQL